MEVFPEFLIIVFLRHHLDERSDGGHGILYFMGQPCRQVAQKREFFGATQKRLRFFQLRHLFLEPAVKSCVLYGYGNMRCKDLQCFSSFPGDAPPIDGIRCNDPDYLGTGN